MTIKAIRVSKTSMKFVDLYGPIETAMMTLIQAQQLRLVTLHVPGNGEQLDFDMWINAKDATLLEGELNMPALMIVVAEYLRHQGGVDREIEAHEIITMITEGELKESVPMVNGPAILTGPGGTDIPEDHLDCLAEALMRVG